MRCGVAGACLALAMLAAAQPGPDQLGRVIIRVGETLKRLPNYTCTETIERWRHGMRCAGCVSMDRVRLEVAVVGGRERYAWPGATQFEDKDLAEMMPGASVTGDFAGVVHGIFFADRAAYRYVEEREEGHRRVMRYDYEVPLESSGFRVGAGQLRQKVAYHGAFWVDAASLDLVRLDVDTGAVADLKIQRGTVSIEYARVAIGGSGFLLPQRTEMEIAYDNGARDRNLTHYSGCRQYVGESTIRFGDDGGAPATAVSGPVEEGEPVAPGLRVESVLDKALPLGHCAVGDPVSATVSRPVKQDGRLEIPKGARLRGRVMRMERIAGQRPLTVVALEFTTLEAAGARHPFRGWLKDGRGLLGGRARTAVEAQGRAAGFFISGEAVAIPQGFQLIWETLEP